MYIDADGHGEEGIPLSGMDAHIMKMVIVEDPVVYPFAGSAVIVDLLIFRRPSRHGSIEADVPFRLGIDAAAIGGWGAFLFTGTVWDAVIHASADFMPIGGHVGMDTGTIAGKGKAVCGDEPVPEGREDSGEAEELLEPFFIMEGEFLMFQGVSSHSVRNAGMLVGKFLPFAGFYWKVLSTCL